MKSFINNIKVFHYSKIKQTHQFIILLKLLAVKMFY